MNRRNLLAALAGTGALLAGCLGDEPAPETGNEDDRSDGDGTENESNGSAEATDDLPDEPSGGTCGPADEALERLLTDDPGDDSACFEGATPSLVVKNARAERIVAHVELDGFETADASVELEPGARTVPGGIVPAADGLEATVTVETDDGAAGDDGAADDDGTEGDGGTDDDGAVHDEALTGTWEERSCRRHAIVIGDDGIETGYVAPLSGPEDTQHDCYAGDGAGLRIYNEYAEVTATVLIDDLCTGERRTEELTLGQGDAESIGDALESGGVYDVTVVLEDGTSETYEFHEECWGLSVGIDEDGGLSIHRMAID